MILSMVYFSDCLHVATVLCSIIIRVCLCIFNAILENLINYRSLLAYRLSLASSNFITSTLISSRLKKCTLVVEQLLLRYPILHVGG